jgi:hypothetical protein
MITSRTAQKNNLFIFVFFLLLMAIPVAIYLLWAPLETMRTSRLLLGPDGPERVKAAADASAKFDKNLLGPAFFALSETADNAVSAPLEKIFYQLTRGLSGKDFFAFYGECAKRIPVEDEYTERLKTAFTDWSSPGRRERALFALAMLKADGRVPGYHLLLPGIEEIISDAARDPSPRVRYKTALVLSAPGWDESVAAPVLAGLLGDEDEPTRQRARTTTLKHCSPSSQHKGYRKKVIETLLIRLRHTSVHNREKAINALRFLTGKKLGYKPAASEETRAAAIRVWENELGITGSK